MIGVVYIQSKYKPDQEALILTLKKIIFLTDDFINTGIFIRYVGTEYSFLKNAVNKLESTILVRT